METKEVKLYYRRGDLDGYKFYDISHNIDGDKVNTSLYMENGTVYRLLNGEFNDPIKYFENDKETAQELYKIAMERFVNISEPYIHKTIYTIKVGDFTYEAFEDMKTNDIFVGNKFLNAYFKDTYKNIYYDPLQSLQNEGRREEKLSGYDTDKKYTFKRVDYCICKDFGFYGYINKNKNIIPNTVYVKEYEDKIIISDMSIFSHINKNTKPIYLSYNIFSDVEPTLVYDKDAELELISTNNYYGEISEMYKCGKSLSCCIIYKKDHVVITSMMLVKYVNKKDQPIFYRNELGNYKRI